MPPAQEQTRLLEDALSAFYVAPPSYKELCQQRFMDDLKAQDDTGGSVRQPLKWRNIILIALVHVLGLCGLIFGLPHLKISSFIMISLYGIAGGIGMTAGAHRLWSHRSFKAKWPLRVILAAFFAISGLTTIFDWVRDHRGHHKFSESNADPHNSKRGLFFSHCGWIMQAKHPSVIQQGKKLDVSDIESDKVAQFFDKHFLFLKGLFCFVIPTLFLHYAFSEPWWLSFTANMARYMISLNGIWIVNSLAHKYGSHPYNKNIQPADNWFVTAYTFGEGWHNFHHTFPMDYSASEIGYHKKNLTTLFIDFFSWIGWAYDLKTASVESIERQAKRLGDRSKYSAMLETNVE